MKEKENLIFIYNLLQAEFIIKETKSKDFFKLGKGSKGDFCVSFYNTENIQNAMIKWNSNKTKK